MRAYFTTNNAADHIVIPELETALVVDPTILRDYFSEAPSFEDWNGLNDFIRPEDVDEEYDAVEEQYGTVLAVRDDARNLQVQERFFIAEPVTFLARIMYIKPAI